MYYIFLINNLRQQKVMNDKILPNSKISPHKISVELDSVSHEIEFDQKIKNVKFAGAINIWRRCSIGFAIGAVFGAVFGAVIFLKNINYNLSNEKKIRMLESTNRIYAQKLSVEGWHWFDGNWKKHKK